MRVKRREYKKMFAVSALCYMVASMTVFLLPFTTDGQGKMSPVDVTIGILFWGGVLAGIILFYLLWKRVKEEKGYKRLEKHTQAGWKSFGVTKPGKIVDIVFGIMCLITIIGSFFIRIPDAIMIVAMFLTLLTFCMHFLLNGRVYRYLCSSDTRKEIKHER